jgi:hypothetical protein
MLHENGAPTPLVSVTARQLRIQAVLGMPSDSGYMVAKSPRSIFVILPMPQCSLWYGQKNFGKPNVEIEQIMVDQNVLVCYNIGILQKQYFNLNF